MTPGVADLHVQSIAATGLTLGACVTLKAIIELCHTQDPSSPTFTNDPATEGVVTATSSYSALARCCCCCIVYASV